MADDDDDIVEGSKNSRPKAVGSGPFQQRLGSAPEKEVLGVVKPPVRITERAGWI